MLYIFGDLPISPCLSHQVQNEWLIHDIIHVSFFEITDNGMFNLTNEPIDVNAELKPKSYSI